MFRFVMTLFGRITPPRLRPRLPTRDRRSSNTVRLKAVHSLIRVCCPLGRTTTYWFYVPFSHILVCYESLCARPSSRFVSDSRLCLWSDSTTPSPVRSLLTFSSKGVLLSSPVTISTEVSVCLHPHLGLGR